MSIKKNIPLLLFLLFTVFYMTACVKGNSPKEIRVTLEETSGYLVENNGLLITPGEDAVFSIKMNRGVSLIGCDYDSDYEINVNPDYTILRLKDVTYPSRISLQVSSKTCSINYEPNGGCDVFGSTEPVLKNYSLIYHLRPNVSIGTDLFYRDGYTLTSWNTKADGSGERIGLGSRVTNQYGTITLYAQWEKWTDAELFSWTCINNEITITSFKGEVSQLVIPAFIEGYPVSTIASDAFVNTTASSIVLPPTLDVIEDGAFDNCKLTNLTIFDNVTTFSDDSFKDCNELKTLYINALEAPYGYVYRKESCYADKVDLLILAEGQKKLVFYGGCSMWYNLDCQQAYNTFGSEYKILNLALNGTVNSAVQMQIMAHYLQEGDVLFHTPELASRPQLMLQMNMREDDSSLWCGLENNYDLLALVDMRSVDGVLDSLNHYLSLKKKRTDYNQFYSDDFRTPYMDSFGGINIYRSKTQNKLSDRVTIKPDFYDSEHLENLGNYYKWYQSLGITIYVSYACVNMDALPEEEKAYIDLAETLFSEQIYEYTGRYPVSNLSNFLYEGSNFYDTNYHLLSETAKENTAIWLRDLKEQMILDGLWEAEK